MNPQHNGEPPSHEDLRRIADATFGFFYWDLATDTIEQDTGLRQLLGRDAKSEMPKPWYLHLPEEDRQGFLADLRDAIAYGGKAFTRLCKLVDAVGKTEWFMVKAAIQRDEANNAKYMVGFLVASRQLMP